MNSIPWYVFLLVAAVGLLLALAGNKSKKQGMAFLGTLLQLVGAILAVCGNMGMFRPEAHKLEANQWTTEAYGVASLIKKNFSGKKVVVLGWTAGPDTVISAGESSASSDIDPEIEKNRNKGLKTAQGYMEQYMNALEKNGVSAKYVAIATFPPIGVSIDQQLDMIETALGKIGDADLIVYRNAVLPQAQLDLMSDYSVIQTNYDQNPVLWEEGVVVASVKAKPGIDPATYPGDFSKAYQSCYEEKINSNKRD